MIFDDFDDLSTTDFKMPSGNHKHNQQALSNNSCMAKSTKKAGDYNTYYEVYQLQINRAWIDITPSIKIKDNEPNTEEVSPMCKPKKNPKQRFFLLLEGCQDDIDDECSSITHTHEKPVNSIDNPLTFYIRDIKIESHHTNDETSVFETHLEKPIELKNITHRTVSNQVSINPQSISTKWSHLIDVNQIRHCSLNLTKNNLTKKTLRKCFSFTNIDLMQQQEQENARIDSFVSLDEVINRPRDPVCENMNCHLCNKEFILNDVVAKLCTCGHSFHKRCIDGFIDEVMGRVLRCPVCESCI